MSTLEGLRSQIASVREAGRASVLYFRWQKDVEAALVNMFDPAEGKRHLREFKDLHDDLAPEQYEAIALGTEWKTFARAMDLSEAYLAAVSSEVDAYYDDDDGPNGDPPHKAPLKQQVARNKEIFIVHGRDHGFKDAVARFLTTIGLSPIILHERPNVGQTLIEKFESNATAHFAVALFTGDDVGQLAGSSEAPSPRARQNVIFEFGFFIGRLGRHRACALVQPGVELPTDYSGVVFIAVDPAGYWKFDLIRELRAAGYDVDANRAL